MADLRYVYAVCGDFDAPLAADLTGVAGSAPRQLHHEGLTVVLSHVSEQEFSEGALRKQLEDLDWLSETARAHQAVLAALGTVTSPLPLRLATVFRDDGSVRAMLEAEKERFESSLARIDGRVEWGVKVYVEETADEAGGDSAAPAGARRERVSAEGLSTGTGRDYLRQRRAQRAGQDEVWRKAEGFAQRLHDHLAPHAEESCIHPPQNPQLSKTSARNILNAAYLVDRSSSETFIQLVDATKDEEAGLRVELTGPWAAYSFSTPLEERGEWEDREERAGESR